MVNVLKQAWLIFKKTPGYIHTMTTFPIIALLLTTVVLSYSKNHNISVIDLSEDGSGKLVYSALKQVEGLVLVDSEYKDAEKKMIGGNVEMVLLLRDGGDVEIMKTSEGSEVEKVVKAIVNLSHSGVEDKELEVSVNPVKKKGLPISYALGVMLFKFITASGIMAGILIREKNNGTRDRILLSGISPFSYLLGKVLVYFGTMVVAASVYYSFCLIFNFDFGMRNSIWFLIIIFITNFFSVGVYSMIASVINDEGAIWSIGTFIFFPMAIFSGAIFPYSTMPLWMQKVGSFFPQRWLGGSIELIQKSGSVVSALPYMTFTVIVGVLCFVVALKNIKKRR